MKESSAGVWSWFHQSQGLQGFGLVKGGLLLIQFCLQRSPIFYQPFAPQCGHGLRTTRRHSMEPVAVISRRQWRQ